MVAVGTWYGRKVPTKSGAVGERFDSRAQRYKMEVTDLQSFNTS